MKKLSLIIFILPIIFVPLVSICATSMGIGVSYDGAEISAMKPGQVVNIKKWLHDSVINKNFRRTQSSFFI